MGGKEKKTKSHKCHVVGCGKLFSRPGRLQQHIRTHTGDRPYACSHEGCDKSYTRSQHLARHIDISHNESKQSDISYKCDTCEQKFASKHSLKKHERCVHCEEKRYLCPEKDCHEGFRKRHQLRVHVFSHRGVLPFQCSYEGCLKRFTQSSHLESHKRSHEGYKCTEEGCDLFFAKMSHYRKHKAKDHKKYFQCGKCEKKFYKKCLLDCHTRVHSEVCEKFKCPKENCDRSYFDSRNLTAHIKSYHEGQKFNCNKCSRQFSTKQKQLQHLKQHDPHYVGSVTKYIPKPGINMAKRLSLYVAGKKDQSQEAKVIDATSSVSSQESENKATNHCQNAELNNLFEPPKAVKSNLTGTMKDSFKLRVMLQDKSCIGDPLLMDNDTGKGHCKFDSENNECRSSSNFTVSGLTTMNNKFENQLSQIICKTLKSSKTKNLDQHQNVETKKTPVISKFNEHETSICSNRIPNYDSNSGNNPPCNDSLAGSSCSDEYPHSHTEIAHSKDQHITENDPAGIINAECQHIEDRDINKSTITGTNAKGSIAEIRETHLCANGKDMLFAETEELCLADNAKETLK